MHYKCDNCNKVFTSNMKRPRCPDCNRVVFKRHNPIKPEKKINYEAKKLPLSYEEYREEKLRDDEK